MLVAGRDQHSRDERLKLVMELDGIGMTQRQIAASVGINQATVSRRLDAGASSKTPNPGPASLRARLITRFVLAGELVRSPSQVSAFIEGRLAHIARLGRRAAIFVLARVSG